MSARVVFLVLFPAARRAAAQGSISWVGEYAQDKRCDSSSQKIAGEQGVPLEECQDRCECDSACLYFHWKSNEQGGWCSRYTTCNLEDKTLYTTYAKLSQPTCLVSTPAPTPILALGEQSAEDDWVEEYAQGKRCDSSSQKIAGEQGVPLEDCQDRCKCDSACLYYHWKSNAQGGWCALYMTCNLRTNTQYTTYAKRSQPECLPPTPLPAIEEASVEEPTPSPTALAYHLAPAGAAACDTGVSPTSDQCLAAVQLLAASAGKTMGRTELQRGSGGACLAYGWGQVPGGCSVQSGEGGDWGAHYKDGSPTAEGCVDAMYQLVCYGSSVPATDSADCASDIDGGGWKMVRHTKGTGEWGPWDDNLGGTAIIGKKNGGQAEHDWTIPWSTPDEFLFALGDCSHWLIAAPSAVIGTGDYSNSERQILQSSISSTPYTAKWYNRASNIEDPWISVGDHATNILYGEASRNSHNSLKNSHGGANVYVRGGTEIEDDEFGGVTLGGIVGLSAVVCGLMVCFAVGSRRCHRKHAPGNMDALANIADVVFDLDGMSKGQNPFESSTCGPIDMSEGHEQVSDKELRTTTKEGLSRRAPSKTSTSRAAIDNDAQATGEEVFEDV